MESAIGSWSEQPADARSSAVAAMMIVLFFISFFFFVCGTVL
jgi:hypothetical protein